MTSFLPEQRETILQLLDLWRDTPFVLIGANALALQIDLEWRQTNDLDFVISVPLEDCPAGLSALPGWQRRREGEHAWLSPTGVKVDVVPAEDLDGEAAVSQEEHRQDAQRRDPGDCEQSAYGRRRDGCSAAAAGLDWEYRVRLSPEALLAPISTTVDEARLVTDAFPSRVVRQPESGARLLIARHASEDTAWRGQPEPDAGAVAAARDPSSRERRVRASAGPRVVAADVMLPLQPLEAVRSAEPAAFHRDAIEPVADAADLPGAGRCWPGPGLRSSPPRGRAYAASSRWV